MSDGEKSTGAETIRCPTAAAGPEDDTTAAVLSDPAGGVKSGSFSAFGELPSDRPSGEYEGEYSGEEEGGLEGGVAGAETDRSEGVAIATGCPLGAWFANARRGSSTGRKLRGGVGGRAKEITRVTTRPCDMGLDIGP